MLSNKRKASRRILLARGATLATDPDQQSQENPRRRKLWVRDRQCRRVPAKMSGEAECHWIWESSLESNHNSLQGANLICRHRGRPARNGREARKAFDHG